MGKALIQSHIGNGQYAIKVYFDNARINQRITALQSFIAKINQDLLDLGTPKNEAYTALQSALMLLNEGIQNEASFDELIMLQKNAMETRRAYDSFIAREKRLKMRQLTSQKEITELQSKCPDFIETTAWCVSRNENLSGETKTIEIDCGVERDPSTNQIRNDTGFWIPATQDQTTAQSPSDILQHVFATSVHATWMNLALLPAVQRDKGRYRVATLTSVNDDTNTCNLVLDGRYTVRDGTNHLLPELPTHPLINGAQQQTISDVSINYPPTDSLVFYSGDKVIVDLDSNFWHDPAVIGFYSYPRKSRRWFITDPIGVLGNAPYSEGIVGATSPAITGSYALTAEIDIHPLFAGLEVVRQTAYNVTISGTSSASKTVTYLGVTVVYSQTITQETQGNSQYTGTNLLNNTIHTASGSGTSSLIVTTNMSINGVNVGKVHELVINETVSRTSAYEVVTSTTFTLLSLRHYIYEDGSIKATQHYSASGFGNYSTQSYSYSSASYDYSRTITGDTRGINFVDTAGTVNNYPSISTLFRGSLVMVIPWPFQQGEFPMTENISL